jgi:SAM-dependent methyltransferase
MGIHEIEFADRFDGIWACASLLHVSEKELENVLVRFHRALKRDGVLYASWKYGEAERCDGERFYCDMTEEKLRRVLARANLKAREGLFDCLECWVAEDSLPSGREQKWLNVVLGKCHREDPVVRK